MNPTTVTPIPLRSRVQPFIRPAVFWLLSLPVLVESVVGAWWDLDRVDYVVETFQHLGYPLYFLTIMGVAKLLAVAVLLLPRLPRLKEWAYAGLLFVYGGASVSHLAVGDEAPAVISPLGFAALTVAAWALRTARPAR
ncbi:hypothetical protein Afil01_04710 [Actinorhabdospora filicis]|uniref:DoxX family protein n=1 Tax=Actinorhabdospora filicis TaxID=1785913 RepID=A0A9W6W6K8_9ACTN|nr:DoxX family protein [Actinorhabdospora filicis]GLZ75664.1 hypothetical protein Afil01_04710 [Actinorhabdospora filicis]